MSVMNIHSASRRDALILFGGAALGAGIAATPGRAMGQNGSDALLTEAAVLRDPEIPAAGNPDGDITIVEYFDYQCSYCRKLEPDLRQVVRSDGKVRWVLKDWPVLGGVSIYAAEMALAAKYQDKYIAAHDALIAGSRLTEGRVRDVLASSGVDADRAARDRDVNKSAIEAIMARNADQAKAFGFRGTPSFIVGKFRVPGVLTTDQFEQVIADARKVAANR